jgi:hypothetical protein
MIFTVFLLIYSESPVVVHAFGDNGANVYQFLHEELRHLGIETRLKAVVFENGPSESFLISRRARDGGQEQLISIGGRFKPVFAQRDKEAEQAA